MKKLVKSLFLVTYPDLIIIFPKEKYSSFHLRFQLSPGNLHIDLARLRDEFGPVFTVFLPKPIVIIADYETIKEALVTGGL